MDVVIQGAELLANWNSLLYLLIGLISGFIVGCIPGFSTAVAAALLVPLSIGLPLELGLLMVVGVYAGSQFAGAVPAILLNIPGDVGTAATAMDGHPLALQGKSLYAIGLARIASAMGGMIAGIIVVCTVGLLADAAIRFGPREMFIVTMCALAVLAGIVGNNVTKSIVSVLLGLALSMVSANPQTGTTRLTLGIPELFEEMPFIPAIIGLFGIAQMWMIATRDKFESVDMEKSASRITGRFLLSDIVDGIRTAFRYPMVIARSSLIGLLMGVIPGIGTSVANFISYSITKKQSKSEIPFGQGNPEGILASEASDNAAASGTLVPTMALGVPGSATAAVMLAMLYINGIEPGPRVITTHGPELYSVFLGAMVASALIIPVGLLLSAPLAAITKIPPRYLSGAILALCVIGAFAYRNSVFDVILALMFGFVGIVMRVKGYPVVPLILGLVLGPIIETNFLRAVAIGGYNISYFFESTIGNVLWSILGCIIVYSIISTLISRKKFRQRVFNVEEKV